MAPNTMRAVNYVGPHKVRVQEVEMPKLEHPDDIIVKVTTAAICGSDLHMYEGRTAAEPGITFGHENMGIVEELGEGVTLLKKGDRVVMPFNVADGRCRNCDEGKTAFCTGVNPGFAGGAYGYVAMGPYRGGQAQYIRVPYADFNALLLPPGTEHEADFVLLADIFPTGWHGVEISGFKSGESIAVFGAGPVGLMAAYSAQLRGASRVFVVDRVPERLAVAEKIGCTPIDFTKGDAVDQIIRLNGGEVDRSVDAVGYQAVDTSGSKEKPNIVLENMIRVTRACGGMGIPGLYVPSDPGASDEGLSLATGQCNVKAYNRYLRDLIIAGKAKPSFVVSHEIRLDHAEVAYEKFDKREDGYTKVLIHPNGGFESTTVGQVS
ncbi:glutathione-independent formaldehyde dehydrogenase [Aspergillus flavus AF70]|uniref:Chaperonin 10-like protein n=1 Tax=Aspergillus minisclerotigenes TaxID=656917 RepID=A0A5N6JDA7_9EURO|nr:chaperonin 10-like protein [Aspergillus minisclerotigenes]KAJ1707634.1 glutathione-independent formaldehyde dehydrogenase [Aspergillus flavus]KOC17174.1 glutathione-independent formaldehyde dehydrogenase [Aspergillus flavus AF70]RAQ52238.1 glutathione-independent formaldehyde dehydrogenase [Aspergillus flavus]